MSTAARFAMPLFILVAAACIGWWSSRAESAVDDHVRSELMRLVQYCDNPRLVERVAINGVVAKPLARSIELICRDWSGNTTDLQIVVSAGDHEHYGDGLATHVATISLEGNPIAGLRIICTRRTEPLQIAGVWTP